MNILLITSGLNNDKSSSWIVFKKYIKYIHQYHNAKIDVVCLTPSLFATKSNLEEITLRTFFRNNLIISILKRFMKSYNWIISNLYSIYYTNRINNLIKNNNINKLWVYADLLPMLLLKKVIEINKIPYHLTIYDDPFNNRGYLPIYKKVKNLFREIFQNAESIDTPTFMLSDYYYENNLIKVNCKTAESYVGVFKDAPKEPTIRQNVKKIALAGSIYGDDAFFAFLTSITEFISNQKIEIHFFSNLSKIQIKYLKEKFHHIFKYIIIKPFVPEHQIIVELQKYDLLYLPMKFDEGFRFQTNTSFPSKTHNYLASGIPIILHSPITSTINSFFEKNNIGCLINTLDPDEIALKFRDLLEKEYRDQLSLNICNFNKKQLTNRHIEKLYNVLTS